ncbi:MAG: cyclic pyranopterin monophosphate synthase MoaC [Bacteroidota bacterium]
MVDISEKKATLRTAVAEAIVKVGSLDTIQAIEQKKVPKGDVFEMSRAAGFLGIKKTPELLPDCHPIPIEFASVDYTIEGLQIKIKMTVKTVYKTGVEVEAMHGASTIALNLYDMLKPIDKKIEIQNIRLLKKTGGKSDINNA